MKFKIKSLKDAFVATNRPATPAFADVPEDMREYFQALYEMCVIAKALNEDWTANWNDGNQKKWIPWLHNDSASSGFAFGATGYGCSGASAGDASRLCFKTKALAEYAGGKLPENEDEITDQDRQTSAEFLAIWNRILMK